MDLAAVLGHAPQPGLLKAELLLDHPEWVLHLRADVGFGGFDKTVQPAIRFIRQKPAFTWSYRHLEFY